MTTNKKALRFSKRFFYASLLVSLLLQKARRTLEGGKVKDAGRYKEAGRHKGAGRREGAKKLSADS